MTVYINNWDGTQPNWGPAQHPNIETLCPNKNGIGQFDLAVRFADIDGNKQADYLCLDLDGRTTGNLASGNPVTFKDVGQVKYAIGADRANIRFADVNGDGECFL